LQPDNGRSHTRRNKPTNTALRLLLTNIAILSMFPQ
jgi:hypothetical protein